MRRILPLLILGLAVLGCNSEPKKVKVTGRLLKDGQPASFKKETYITLMFRPEKGDTSFSATVNPEAGTYVVELIPGKYYVSLFLMPEGFNFNDPKSAPKPPTGGGGGELTDLTTVRTLDIPVPK